jgi:ABC-type nitrate/sulfonate/bicarbonate transport system permease component
MASLTSKAAGGVVPTGTMSAEVVIKPGAMESDPARWARRRNRHSRILAWAFPLALIVAWEVATRFGAIDTLFVPGPEDLGRALWELVRSGTYLEHLWASVQRLGVGFVAGSLAGFTLGAVLGQSRLARSTFEPTLVGLYTVPKLSILPLLILIFGIGELTKYVIVGLSAFFVVVLSTTAAMATVPDSYLEAGRSLGARRLTLFWHVSLPASVPHIFTGLRVAAGLSIATIVGAEFVAARSGLGFLIWNSWNLGLTEDVYIGIVSLAMLGVLANLLLLVLERLAAPWTRK